MPEGASSGWTLPGDVKRAAKDAIQSIRERGGMRAVHEQGKLSISPVVVGELSVATSVHTGALSKSSPELGGALSTPSAHEDG